MSLAIEILDSCASTNAVLAERTDAQHGTVIATRTQTAGRGQRGNSWEAEPGKNLTFSLLLCPKGFPAVRQFELSMLVALGVADTLNSLFAQLGCRDLEARIKWPNDIYIGDEKIAGILIENQLGGVGIDRSIVGIGLNVNQTEFLSDAPNPTSVARLVGSELALEPLLGALANVIVEYVDQYLAAPQPEALRQTYIQCMYPGYGIEATYTEPGGQSFRAIVMDVASDGRLSLSNGRHYYFKEVALVLPTYALTDGVRELRSSDVVGNPTYSAECSERGAVSE